MTRLFLSIAVLLALSATARAKEFDPYKVTKDVFRARVHTIALRPLLVPAGTPNPQAVRGRFESLIADELHAKGYRVVPSTEFERIWGEMSERLGGTYDPTTGAVRKEQFQAALDHTGRELARVFGVDALLEPNLSYHTVNFGGFFTYSAGGESLTWRGHSIAVSGLTRPQKVIAVWLGLVITDLSDTTLYSIAFPIEWTRVYAARGYEDKPKDRLFEQSDRCRQAVEEDLEPLVAAAGGKGKQ